MGAAIGKFRRQACDVEKVAEDVAVVAKDVAEVAASAERIDPAGVAKATGSLIQDAAVLEFDIEAAHKDF